MTITVTVEELRNYQAAMEEWAKQRGAAFEEVALNLAERHHDFEAQQRLARRDETIEQNLPMPKLMPKL